MRIQLPSLDHDEKKDQDQVGYKQKDKNWWKQYQLSNAHARMKL